MTVSQIKWGQIWVALKSEDSELEAWLWYLQLLHVFEEIRVLDAPLCDTKNPESVPIFKIDEPTLTNWNCYGQHFTALQVWRKICDFQFSKCEIVELRTLNLNVGQPCVYIEHLWLIPYVEVNSGTWTNNYRYNQPIFSYSWVSVTARS